MHNTSVLTALTGESMGSPFFANFLISFIYLFQRKGWHQNKGVSPNNVQATILTASYIQKLKHENILKQNILNRTKKSKKDKDKGNLVQEKRHM